MIKPSNNDKVLDGIQKKYKLPSKYVLYVGDININKNIPTLVMACQKLNYPLVIVGKAATQKNVIDHPWNRDLVWLQNIKDPNVKCLGFVPNSDLKLIYNLATLYCQPSFSEGFGLPLLEAMQSGCPIVYSSQGCVAEIANFHGEMFDPYSVDDLTRALKKLWRSESLRHKYSIPALSYAKTFSWYQTALQTLAVYKLALSSND